MKALNKVLVLVVITPLLTFSCGPKPQYKTAAGKKKLQHYNALQYNRGDWDRAKQ